MPETALTFLPVSMNNNDEDFVESLEEFILLCELHGWSKVLSALQKRQPEGYEILKREFQRTSQPRAALLREKYVAD